MMWGQFQTGRMLVFCFAMEGDVTIRTYRGKTIAEALAQVKKDLGRNAVILNTRTYRTGGVLGFWSRTMTEITASDQQPAPAKRPMRRAPEVPSTQIHRDAAPEVQSRNARASVEASAPVAAEPANQSLKQMAQMIMASTAVRPAIEDELAAIKRMVGQVLRSSQTPTASTMPEALFDCYRKLLESEVATEIAGEIAGAVQSELSGADLQDESAVRRAVLRRLAAHIPVCEEVPRIGRAPDGRPLTIALVGPTGVGKTTTIAKLAATYKLRHGRRVGLVTCDTYRIAAVEQLRTYASIINLPMKVAMTAAEMRAAIAALGECDVILIDTAGRSPRDAARLDELKELLAAAMPHEIHLVLSSAASQTALMEAAERFGGLGCDRVILTKLDEAVSFGVLVNIVSKLKTRLSFITNGQEVPDHIEPGSPERLARLILGTEVMSR